MVITTTLLTRIRRHISAAILSSFQIAVNFTTSFKIWQLSLTSSGYISYWRFDEKINCKSTHSVYSRMYKNYAAPQLKMQQVHNKSSKILNLLHFKMTTYLRLRLREAVTHDLNFRMTIFSMLDAFILLFKFLHVYILCYLSQRWDSTTKTCL